MATTTINSWGELLNQYPDFISNRVKSKITEFNMENDGDLILNFLGNFFSQNKELLKQTGMRLVTWAEFSGGHDEDTNWEFFTFTLMVSHCPDNILGMDTPKYWGDNITQFINGVNLKGFKLQDAGINLPGQITLAVGE